MTTRRELMIKASVLVLATPRIVLGQQKEKVLRIGYVGNRSQPSPFVRTFREELRRLGYSEGKTIVFDYRGAEGRLDRMSGLVEDLIRSKVDVLVVENLVALRAAQQATTTIPIAMIISTDPVAAGFAKSLQRPGGNVTGVSNLRTDLCTKRIELLRELIPGLSRVAVLWDSDGVGPRVRLRDYLTAAQNVRLKIESLEVKGATPDFENAFQNALTNRAQALIVITNPTLTHHHGTIMSLATRHRLPTIAESAVYVEAGALFAYSADADETAKILAGIVGKILKGAHPKDLPIEQPTKFELILNMKTAKAFGIKIPQSILVRADRVIE